MTIDRVMGGMWMILGLVGLCALAAWAVRTVGGARRTHPDALQVLDERLVRGEITTEEYRRVRRQFLSSGH